MTTDLETELRAALRDRVAHVTSDRLQYAERDEALAEAPDAVMRLRRSLPKTGARRSVLLLTTAAAAAAVAVTGVVLFGATRTGTPPAHQFDVPAIRSANLRIPFTPTDSDTTITAVFAQPESLSLRIHHGSGDYEVAVFPQGMASLQLLDPTPTRIGAAAALYQEADPRVGCGIPNADKYDGVIPSGQPQSSWIRCVEWKVPLVGTVLVQTGAVAVTASKAQLLAAAKTLDFSKPAALRSTISLKAAPPSTALVEVSASFTSSFDPANQPLVATYQSVDGSGPGFSIQVMDGRDRPSPEQAAVEVDVDGVPGTWDPANRLLVVAFAPTVRVAISEFLNGTTHEPSLDQVTAVARSITVAPHPEDPSTWFDAAEALPVG
jgi:hypothetical protein